MLVLTQRLTNWLGSFKAAFGLPMQVLDSLTSPAVTPTAVNGTDRYLDLYEFAPIPFLTLDRKGVIIEINFAGAKLLGMQRAKLLQRRFADCVANSDRSRWQQLFKQLLDDRSAESQGFDLRLQPSDGQAVAAHFVSMRRQTNAETASLRLALLDISQLMRQDDSLRIAASAFEMQEGLFITDANCVIIKVNQAFTKITGYSAEEAIGQTPRLFRSGCHDAAFYAAMWESLSRNGVWLGEVLNRRKNGEIYPQWLSITAVKGCTVGDGQHYVAMLTDIAEQKAAAEQIERLAFYDPLTNLPNRRLLRDRLHQAIASSMRSKRQGALLFIDLDNFKTLNDTRGHDVGDMLLQQVADRLQQCVREGDTVARLGGDEFVVMLNELSEASEEATLQTEIAGKKILDSLNQVYHLAGYDYFCTPSIGATLFGEYAVTEDHLLKRVDVAMYQAKRTGRNTLCFFDKAMQSELTASAALEDDLRQALQNQQLHLFYQMQITNKRSIVGAEVVLRWQHPLHGQLSADTFIGIAEETGLIVPIGNWVLDASCAQLKRWEVQPSTRDLQLTVNISARQFHQTDFVERVRQAVQDHGIAPQRLKLELSKRIMLDDIDRTIVKMQALNDLEVRFILDDFGAGKSSLAMLTQLPFGQLKIDRHLVSGIGVKDNDEKIIQIIIDMAERLGMSVVAEGVETLEQLTFLERHGCHLSQGYLFGKPADLSHFERSLKHPPDLLSSHR
jgi:diguanylate cyclase (GGDEF)-like protein/PAS domain S-box-containing protein